MKIGFYGRLTESMLDKKSKNILDIKHNKTQTYMAIAKSIGLECIELPYSLMLDQIQNSNTSLSTNIQNHNTVLNKNELFSKLIIEIPAPIIVYRQKKRSFFDLETEINGDKNFDTFKHKILSCIHFGCKDININVKTPIQAETLFNYIKLIKNNKINIHLSLNFSDNKTLESCIKICAFYPNIDLIPIIELQNTCNKNIQRLTDLKKHLQICTKISNKKNIYIVFSITHSVWEKNCFDHIIMYLNLCNEIEKTFNFNITTITKNLPSALYMIKYANDYSTSQYNNNFQIL